MFPQIPVLSESQPFAKSVLDRPTSFVHALDLSVDPYLTEIPSAFALLSESLDPDPDLLTPVSFEISRSKTDDTETVSGRNLLLGCLNNQICSTDEHWDEDSLVSGQSVAKVSGLPYRNFHIHQANVEGVLSPVSHKQLPHIQSKIVIRVQSDDVVTRYSTAVSDNVELDSMFKRKSSVPMDLCLDAPSICTPNQHTTSPVVRRSWRRSKFFQPSRGKVNREVHDGTTDVLVPDSEKEGSSRIAKRESLRLSHVFGLSRRLHTDSASQKNRQGKSTKSRFSSVLERVANKSPRLMSRLCKMFVQELTIPSNVAITKFRTLLEKTYNATVEEKDNTLNAKLILNSENQALVANMALIIENLGLTSCVYMRQTQNDHGQISTETFEKFCSDLCSLVVGR